MFTVTLQWINDNQSGISGWRARQLQQIGVPWPPPKGWKNLAVGLVISDEQRRIFEAFAKVQQPRLIKDPS